MNKMGNKVTSKKDTVKHSKAQTQKGNTKDSVSKIAKKKRTRGWCWTLNNYTEEELKKIKKLSTLSTVEKLIFGKEVGNEKKTEHLQGYIYWSYGKTLEDMKRINERWHLEEAKGGYMSQTIYCTKDGNFYQKGMDKYLKAMKEDEDFLNDKKIKKWDKSDKLDIEVQDGLDDMMHEYNNNLRIVDEEYDDSTEEALWSQIAEYGSDSDDE